MRRWIFCPTNPRTVLINVKLEFGEGDDKISLDAIVERAKKYQPKEKAEEIMETLKYFEVI